MGTLTSFGTLLTALCIGAFGTALVVIATLWSSIVMRYPKDRPVDLRDFDNPIPSIILFWLGLFLIIGAVCIARFAP